MAENTQANPQGLMHIGEVAARNIALVLNIDEKQVPTIERAIRDEISAMSSHFTMAFAAVQTAHEIAENELKSAYRYVQSNVKRVIAVIAGVFALGVVTGLLI